MSDNKIDRSSNNTANRYQGADGPSTSSRTDGPAEIQSTDAAPDADAASAADSAAIGDSNDALQNSSRRLRQATGPGPSRRKNPWDADIEKNGVAHDLGDLMRETSADGLNEKAIRRELWGDALGRRDYDSEFKQKQFQELANHPREFRAYLVNQGLQAGKSAEEATAAADRMIATVRSERQVQIDDYGADPGGDIAMKAPAPDLEEGAMGERLEGSLKSAELESLRGGSAIDAVESFINDASAKELRQMIGHPEKLKAFIAEKLEGRSDIEGDWIIGETRQEKIDSIASRYVGEAEAELKDRLKGNIADKAEKQVDAALKLNQKINESPESRRRFLASIAARAKGDPKVIQSALQRFGIDGVQGELLSQSMAEIGTDPDKMKRFLAGELDPSVTINREDLQGEMKDTLLDLWEAATQSDNLGLIFEGGDAVEISTEKLLKQSLDDSEDQLTDMAFRITNDKTFRNDELLTDPNFRHVRADAYREMGVDNQLVSGTPMHNSNKDYWLEPSSGLEDENVTYKNPITKSMNEELMGIEEQAGREENVVFGLELVGGMAFGPAGLVAGVGSGMAGDGFKAGLAHQETQVARGAYTAGLTDRSAVQEADSEFRGAVTSTITNALWAVSGDQLLGKLNETATEKYGLQPEESIDNLNFNSPARMAIRDEASGLAQGKAGGMTTDQVNTAILAMMEGKPEETPEELQDDVEDMRLKAQQQDF